MTDTVQSDLQAKAAAFLAAGTQELRDLVRQRDDLGRKVAALETALAGARDVMAALNGNVGQDSPPESSPQGQMVELGSAARVVSQSEVLAVLEAADGEVEVRTIAKSFGLTASNRVSAALQALAKLDKARSVRRGVWIATSNDKGSSQVDGAPDRGEQPLPVSTEMEDDP